MCNVWVQVVRKTKQASKIFTNFLQKIRPSHRHGSPSENLWDVIVFWWRLCRSVGDVIARDAQEVVEGHAVVVVGVEVVEDLRECVIVAEQPLTTTLRVELVAGDEPRLLHVERLEELVQLGRDVTAHDDESSKRNIKK